MVKLLIILNLSFLAIGNVFASGPLTTSNEVIMTVGKDAIKSIRTHLNLITPLQILGDNDEVVTIKVNSSQIKNLSHLMHEEFNRCGGFVAHESIEDAQDVLQEVFQNTNKSKFINYSISEQNKVNALIPQLEEAKIRQTIQKLSSYHNRYYTASTGKEALEWIKGNWEQLAYGRTDVDVEYFNHSKWPQPSVILTLHGHDNPDEIVVLGGHADSISGFWNSKFSRAPGADDNASGIGTITEVIRILLASDHKPSKTIKFMAYAAEEVGLKGSNEIASRFRQQGKNVIGVMQLDMTGHQAGQKHIALMTDYTNSDQNQFIGNLIDTYVHVPWGHSKCGYGCSDHVSWHNNGFPASMPFETEKDLMNRKIHTPQDTLENIGGTAQHPLKFAKLGLSFVIELAK